MPKVETYKLKIGLDEYSININFSPSTQLFSVSDFPYVVSSTLSLTRKDFEFKTYQEVIDALHKAVDQYVPFISKKEKVILVYAHVTGQSRNQFEDDFKIDMFKDTKATNEFAMKYGFLSGNGWDMSKYPSVSFRYELAYRIQVGEHTKYLTVDSFNEGEVEHPIDAKEWNTMILEYTPETEKFVQDFQEALEKLSKKLIDFFVELKTNTQKCIIERKKFLEIGE